MKLSDVYIRYYKFQFIFEFNEFKNFTKRMKIMLTIII